ncbi:SOM1 protein [Ophiocordyceps sinensis CO18]|uniref:SOM1 protein n=1 Tax=Ophiocordyceps sinensis (strain Co18 / CGMCC 3.14243) TaxID=911162 RepID=T5A6E4_OPHSC|nr:SOM1 protein [Ophiocordyceps sinensis CO18]
MNPNVGAANMNPMGGPVGAGPMPMMNNVAGNPHAAAAAAAAAARQQQMIDNQRGVLNTYIYEYFIRYGMFECARSLLSSDQQVNVLKDGVNRRRDDGGNVVNGADDPMDTDSKSDLDGKLPDDLPPPKLPMPASDTSQQFQNPLLGHLQRSTRKGWQRQRQPIRLPYPAHMMRNMQNGNVNMGIKQGNLARAAMANNQHPQMMLQHAKQNQMQRDPSNMDANRERPSSPASGENAPSPSKRPRIDGAPFNPNQPGAMMANGRPGQGMPGQQLAGNPNAAAAHQMLTANGINPNTLNPQQFQNFVNAPPAAQQKSIATYSQNLQHHHGTQIVGKQMPNAAGPQNQGSPMMQQGPDGSALNAFYNPGEMAGPGGIRPGPGAQAAAGSNHALQDYQMQLMLLEQQNKKRLMMARQEQDNMPGMPRETGGPGGPGGAQGPNGQPFPDSSPQAMRSGASPNPSEQMKRGTPQMNNSGIPSPVPEGGQSRGSPNPAMNFMGNHVDPNMAPHFFKGMEGNMAAAQAQMNGGMRPPSSHPGQPFNGQMNQQQMMAARQQQQQQQQGQQPQQGQQQGGPGTPQQWQQGPNGQMVPQGMPPQNPQMQGTPQQRSMPPPSAPAAGGNNANNRTTASPQQASAAPPTPNQSNKAAPKKKETKAAKDKRTAAQKKANQNTGNAGATPAGESSGEPDGPAPATPITPVNPGFNKNGQNGAAANSQGVPAAPAPTAPASAPAPQAAAAASMSQQGQGDPNQNGSMSMDNFGSMVDFGSMELANPLQSGDVLNDFDFDSFLHEDNNEPFDFNVAFPGMEGGEIGAE